MTFLTQGDEVIWCVASCASAFKVMHVEFNPIVMGSTRLAGIVISVKDVLSQVVIP